MRLTQTSREDEITHQWAALTVVFEGQIFRSYCRSLIADGTLAADSRSILGHR